jgi:lipopolysaccharide transport system ATP-binding protein
MSETIIKVEDLGKKFVIGHQQPQRYTALRDIMAERVKGLLSRSASIMKGDLLSDGGEKEDFWALRHVDFEIKQGERVGIIGRNGAGKSTLLKLLSRITEPTEGRITIRGRVASLLEVGTGFHPELSGRENIYLNGAILGMSRAEIKKKFDEIVAFAEVEKFLDTPVKRYSSGMYVRLAFAVAAHLEPEILIVDEVLAVGDAQFQKKSLGKMEEVSRSQGRTVLFVSHNMGAIKSLCTSAIVMHKGQKILQGDVFDSLSKYLAFDQSELNKQMQFVRGKAPGKKIWLDEVDLVDDQTRDYFCLELYLKIMAEVPARIGINIRLKDGMGFPVAFGCSHYFLPELSPIAKGENRIRLTSTKMALAAGSYKIGVELVIPGIEVLDSVEDCVQFDLSNDGAAKRNYGVAQNWGYGATEITFENIVG